jgi:hypothetical protein
MRELSTFLGDSQPLVMHWHQPGPHGVLVEMPQGLTDGQRKLRKLMEVLAAARRQS